ncbi:MAG: GTP 3',8-cyclase MoaA [Pseudomonadales bacterium]|nr:GTP 3',8-cyclase MoaA [Pseudomonadales bacterium]
MESNSTAQLVDRFGRQVTYVRLSVTDRCDFRCVYCMDEEMTFLTRQQVLSLEELALVAKAFVGLGVKKIRLTGGEPLIRRNVIQLVQDIGALDGLQDFTLTTNGSQLPKYANQLVSAGMSRINISLDSLKSDRFRELTRTGDLDLVLQGIEAARSAGFKKIKLNSVIMMGRNFDEVLDLVNFACEKGLDISFIEEMPLGQITEHSRAEAFCSSDVLRDKISEQYTLLESAESTGGPSRYFNLAGSDTKVGFISPHSHNFCGDCNRVRVTAEGRLLLCLGNEHSVDLKAVIRKYPDDVARLQATLLDAMSIKPERHYFSHEEDPQILRFMNMTGG